MRRTRGRGGRCDRACAARIPARGDHGGGAARVERPMTYAGVLARGGTARPEAIRLYETARREKGVKLAGRGSVSACPRAAAVGSGAAARTALRGVATQYASVEAASAPALHAAGRSADRRRRSHRRGAAAWAESCGDIPASSQAPLARFHGALLTLDQWRPRRAAAMFDSLATRHPVRRGGAARRATGRRARSSAPDDATRRRPAGAAIASGSPLTYYGVASARRLGPHDRVASRRARRRRHASRPWTPAAERIRALRLLGMDVEASFEVEALVPIGEHRSAAAAATIAQTLIDSAIRREGSGSPCARSTAAGPAVARAAARRRSRCCTPRHWWRARARLELDPALVAGLIRQESTWNPDAVSRWARADSCSYAVGRRIDRFGTWLSRVGSGAALRSRREHAARHASPRLEPSRQRGSRRAPSPRTTPARPA